MSSLASADALDLTRPSTELTRLLCDIPSVSGDEALIADTIEAALAPYPHLEVLRLGNTIVARTSLGRAQRVAIAGHIDTVPINENVPTRPEVLTPEQAAADVPGTQAGEYLWGRGTVDMKAGVAVQLRLAAELTEPAVDVTWIWYDNEEVASDLNGLGRLADARPDLLAADFAILGEPTKGEVEGGCNGTIRVDIRTRGKRAHSARAWVGENAIHRAAPILARLAAFDPATVPVEGLDYREGLNAVRISGGVAGNVIPDECVVHVNYRFAPDKSLGEAEAKLREWFGDFELDFVDRSPAARPGLDAPLARGFLEAVGAEAKPKYGWTDVARFSALGIPAVNYGPGDPLKAHADDERVLLTEITRVEEGLRTWLTSR
ncbi:succinyl-diaminopimelate desuccinylase [Pseudoclavibacter sp. RFBA6]|uniref:succinyl-diaminopimelate desuccinylase n=1 Tax=Pseudoclavibacter sp. RFBA6 TaxID=2080573 RepID=UPI000CE8DAF0|nr:succinyl-diaminopimelate desuccinylase [Pseudoclavibacter sp. RFBA6]PPG39541.1 succinyl-diaminopimelate desuccinylase [Pseudoclavibacter sp. RFBA6]